MKKLPLVFSGCLLGLAGAGNLILDTLPVPSHLFSLTGLILWIYFLILHLFKLAFPNQLLDGSIGIA